MLSALLNKVIIIEKGTNGKNTIGSPVFTWSEYMTTYSNVFTPSGDTKFTQDGQIFAYVTEFKIRYNTKTKILNNKYRIKYNDNYYKILQVSEIGIKEGMKITAIAFEDE